MSKNEKALDGSVQLPDGSIQLTNYVYNADISKKMVLDLPAEWEAEYHKATCSKDKCDCNSTDSLYFTPKSGSAQVLADYVTSITGPYLSTVDDVPADNQLADFTWPCKSTDFEVELRLALGRNRPYQVSKVSADFHKLDYIYNQISYFHHNASPGHSTNIKCRNCYYHFQIRVPDNGSLQVLYGMGWAVIPVSDVFKRDLANIGVERREYIDKEKLKRASNIIKCFPRIFLHTSSEYRDDVQILYSVKHQELAYKLPYSTSIVGYKISGHHDSFFYFDIGDHTQYQRVYGVRLWDYGTKEYEYAVTAIDTEYLASWAYRRTPQKILGLKYMERGIQYRPSPTRLLDHKFFPHPDTIFKGSILFSYSMRTFARPCPITPRHGFVDSRIVTSEEQAKELLEDAKRVDPEAWLATCYYVDSTHSAILVADAGHLAISIGNAGATGGEKSLCLPVVPFNDFENIHLAGIDDQTESIYLEFVHGTLTPQSAISSNDTFCTQLRGGPKFPRGNSEFLPKRTKVRKVLVPSDDLLEWEKVVASHKGERGVVAWKPGASISCHAAIHCVAAGIPFLTREEEPKLGSIVQARKSCKISKREFDRNFARGWNYGIASLGDIAKSSWDPNDCTSAYERLCDQGKAAISIIHNAVSLQSSEHWPCLFGYATAILGLLGMAACSGEARHLKKSKGPRHAVHRKILTLPVQKAFSIFRECIPVFSDIFRWGWGSGYGGIKWLDSALTVSDLMWKACEKDYDGALIAANRVINVAHNGGKLLNKFIPGHEFDKAARFPAMSLANSHHIIYGILTSEKDVSTKLNKLKVSTSDISKTRTIKAYVYKLHPDDEPMVAVAYKRKNLTTYILPMKLSVAAAVLGTFLPEYDGDSNDLWFKARDFISGSPSHTKIPHPYMNCFCPCDLCVIHNITKLPNWNTSMSYIWTHEKGRHC